MRNANFAAIGQENGVAETEILDPDAVVRQRFDAQLIARDRRIFDPKALEPSFRPAAKLQRSFGVLELRPLHRVDDLNPQ